jgi:phosphoserine phosphatase
VQAIDRTTAGATLDATADHTRWMSLDGRVSWVVRRGATVVIVVGAPAWAAAPLAAELAP